MAGGEEGAGEGLGVGVSLLLHLRGYPVPALEDLHEQLLHGWLPRRGEARAWRWGVRVPAWRGEQLTGGCCGNGDGLENFESGRGNVRDDEICAAVQLPLPRSRGEPLILGAWLDGHDCYPPACYVLWSFC
jgi:hypothetical protein